MGRSNNFIATNSVQPTNPFKKDGFMSRSISAQGDNLYSQYQNINFSISIELFTVKLGA